MTTPQQAWEAVKSGKLKLSQLNDEGKKMVAQYGLENGYLKKEQLNSSTLALLGNTPTINKPAVVIPKLYTPNVPVNNAIALANKATVKPAIQPMQPTQPVKTKITPLSVPQEVVSGAEKYLANPQWKPIAQAILKKDQAYLMQLSGSPAFKVLPQELRTFINDAMTAKQSETLANSSPLFGRVSAGVNAALDTTSLGFAKDKDGTLTNKLEEDLRTVYPKSSLVGDIGGTLVGGVSTFVPAKVLVSGAKALAKKAGKEITEEAAEKAAKAVTQKYGENAAIAAVDNALYGLAYDVNKDKDGSTIIKDLLLNASVGGVFGGVVTKVANKAAAKTLAKEDALTNNLKTSLAKDVDMPDIEFGAAMKTVKTGEVITPKQLARLHSISKGNKAAVDEVVRGYGYASSKDVTKAEYDDIVSALESKLKGETVAYPKVEKPSPINANTADVIKNISHANYSFLDIERIIKKAFPGEAQSKYVMNKYINPLFEAKAKNIQMQKELLDGLNNVTRKAGIKKGSRESKLLMQYGEKRITEAELRKAAPNKADAIIKADEWFRKTYNDLIDSINAEKKRIYGNDIPEYLEQEIKTLKKNIGIKQIELNKILAKESKNKLGTTYLKTDKLKRQIKNLEESVASREEKLTNDDYLRRREIPKRQDYYHHAQDFTEGLGALKTIADTPSQIPADLIAVSEYTKPKTKFLDFAQKRSDGGKFKEDAVFGMLRYIPKATAAQTLDAPMNLIRDLGREVEKAAKGSGKDLAVLRKYFEDYAGSLAGKSHAIDRAIADNIPGGRATLRALEVINNRTKANVMLANFGSLLSQTANIPAGIAKVGVKYSSAGMKETVKSIFSKNSPMTKSPFLQERYADGMFRKFDTKWFEQPKKLAQVLIEDADRIGASFIWNSSYQKALAEGIQEPIKYADKITRSIVAGRGIGEVPLIQQSSVFKLIAPFQIEVTNLWHVQKDMVDAGEWGKIVLLYMGNYLFNNMTEELRGSRVVFDPIDAIIEAATTEDINPLQRVGRLGGEVLSNMPLGQSIAAAYPEYGGVFGSREDLFGENDPTRFGSGLLLTQGLKNPGSRLVLPFGGVQVKKTYEGLKSLANGGVYNKDKELKYPVNTNNYNTTKGLLFGNAGFSEAKDYFNSNSTALTGNQTADYQKMLARGYSKDAAYGILMGEREVRSLESKISNIKKDRTISENERKKQIAGLTQDILRAKQKVSKLKQSK